MSGWVAGLVWKYYPHGGNERMLAAKLADNADDAGRNIYPSVATLASATMLSERTVQRLLKRMVQDGWLLIVRHARGGGRGGDPGRPREYRINPDWIKAGEMGDKLTPISSRKKVTPRAEMGDTAVSEMGDTAVSPEPSITSEEPNTPPTPRGGRARMAKAPGPDAGPPAPAGFDAILRAYPRKSGVSRAAAEYARLAPDAALQAQMLASIRAWTQDPEWQRDGGRYVPRLSKWLEQERWLDVPGRTVETPPPAPAAPIVRELTPEERERAREAREAQREKINELLGRASRKAVPA
jgi:DNA-binding MarR family transcriptional regulator